MAACQAFDGEIKTAAGTVALNGLQGVGGTARREAAVLAQPGTEEIPVGPNTGQQQGAHTGEDKAPVGFWQRL